MDWVYSKITEHHLYIKQANDCMFKHIQCTHIQIFLFISSAFDGETVKTNQQPFSDLKIFTCVHSFVKMYDCKVKKVHQPLQAETEVLLQHKQ